MSSGNSLDCLKSTIVTGQKRHSPLTQHDYNKNVITIEDAKNSKDLWLQVYEALELREPDLITNYKCLLAPIITNSADLSLNFEFIEIIINSSLQNREIDQWVINFDKKPVKVREQSEKIIKFIFWSKNIVSKIFSA